MRASFKVPFSLFAVSALAILTGCGSVSTVPRRGRGHDRRRRQRRCGPWRDHGQRGDGWWRCGNDGCRR